MLDYNARFYDSTLGRFLTPDSIVPDYSNPQDLNRYSYVRNNPVRFTDPTGHYTFEEGPDDIWNYDSGTPEVIQSAYPGEDVSAYGPVTLGEVLLPAVALYGTGALFSIGVPAVAEAGWMGVTAGWSYASSLGTAACADGDCTNETSAIGQTIQRIRVIYDSTLPRNVAGTTDRFGNIRLNPTLPRLDRLQTLYHEQVHTFFTPRGPLQNMRANISMWAYQNSHLLRCTEEAIAESRAQLLTGGSLQQGVLFPIKHGYVTIRGIYVETGIVLGGILHGGNKLANEVGP